MPVTTLGVCYWYSTLNNSEISRLRTPNIKFHKNLFHDSRHVVPWGTRKRQVEASTWHFTFRCIGTKTHKTKPMVQSLQFVQKNCQRIKLKKKNNDLCILITAGLPRLCETFYFFQIINYIQCKFVYMFEADRLQIDSKLRAVNYNLSSS